MQASTSLMLASMSSKRQIGIQPRGSVTMAHQRSSATATLLNRLGPRRHQRLIAQCRVNRVSNNQSCRTLITFALHPSGVYLRRIRLACPISHSRQTHSHNRPYPITATTRPTITSTIPHSTIHTNSQARIIRCTHRNCQSRGTCLPLMHPTTAHRDTATV